MKTNNYMKYIQPTINKNLGLSLIEMMISMVLGLFLVGGLTTMYLGSKKSDKVRTAVSDIEENARLTLNTIRSAVEHAGYTSVANLPVVKPFQTPIDGNISNDNCSDDKPLVTNAKLTTPPSDFTGYTKDGDVDTLESDRITVIYRADNPSVGPIYFDCGGKANAYLDADSAKQTARQLACSTDMTNANTNHWDAWKSKVYNGLYVNKSDKTLHCFGSRSATGSHVLAENIENMQIRYGVMTTNSAGNKITTYKSASQVEAAKQWEGVTSIQVAILMSSAKPILDQAESHSFELLDETISISEDKKLYRTYSTTIHLPNRSRRELATVTRPGAQAP